jgi:hypothetical protein
MSIRNTIIAVVALVILGGLAYFASRSPEPAATHQLFNIKPADIQSIQLKSPSRDILIRRASNASWQMTRPVLARADGSVADQMAGAIANLQVTGTADPNPTDLAPFGLEQPAVTLTVTTSNGTTLPSILVGKDAPVGSNSFIKLSDSPAILLVASVFPGEVVKNTDDLRSHELFSLKPAEVIRIVITRSDGTNFEFDQLNGKWEIIKPSKYAADANQVTQMLDSIAAARANNFILDNPAITDLNHYGLAHPSASVTLYGGNDNRAETLQFGFEVPDSTHQIYARRAEGNQPVCDVADYLVKSISHNLDEYRDKTVLPADRSSIGNIRLQGGPFDVTVTRAANGKWMASTNGKTAPADPDVVASLLDQITTLKGDSVAAPEMTDSLKYGMAKPNLLVTVGDQHGKLLGTIKLSQMEVTANPKSPETGQKPVTRAFGYAISSMSPAVYEIQPQHVIDLENTTSHLSAEAASTPSPSPSPVAAAPALKATPSAARPEQPD